LRAQRNEPLLRERPDPCPILGRVECEQFADLLKRETGCLRGTDEPKPTNIVVVIAPDTPRLAVPIRSSRRPEEAPPLIVANCLDTHIARARQPGNRKS